MAVNILLADDHRMVREGLKQLLETDSEINVVAEAGDGLNVSILLIRQNLILFYWILICLIWMEFRFLI